MKTHWKDEPDEHDFPAALEFLSLLTSPIRATQLVAYLRQAPTVTRKAKDLLRASRLEPLPHTNAHVAKDLEKVKDGEKLSPVLIVRSDPMIIADGFHRICASYYLDENTEVPCRIA